MNAIQKARTGYGASAQPLRTPRGAEYDAFARITSRLKSAAETRPLDMPALAAAVHDNRRLWTLLATDAADDGNRLPDQTRAQILSLAEFTRQQSGKVLRSRATVAPLIEVNTAIMRGLRVAGPSAQGRGS